LPGRRAGVGLELTALALLYPATCAASDLAALVALPTQMARRGNRPGRWLAERVALSVCLWLLWPVAAVFQGRNFRRLGVRERLAGLGLLGRTRFYWVFLNQLHAGAVHAAN
jgi:hypothetical protein